jgi:hypothetical protein
MFKVKNAMPNCLITRRKERFMLINRKKVVIAAALAVAVVALVTQVGVSGEPLKLEGAWVAKVISYEGVPGAYPFQWSYVLAPDPSGRTAALNGSVIVGFPLNPQLPYDFHSPITGEIVQTGPDTATFNSYTYAIRKGLVTDQIVFVTRTWGEAKTIAEGKLETTHHFEIYLPSADADGDGIPDEGSVPITSFTVGTQDTRIPPPR